MWGAIIGGLVEMGGNIIGQLISEGKVKEAEDLLYRAAKDNVPLDPPSLNEYAMQVLGDSEFKKIMGDPSLREAQMHALDKMREIEDAGGLTLEDKAVLNKQLNETARRESGQRQLITEQMNARGTGGSGAELAMQLANAQGAADRNNQAGLDVAGMAQKRYFDAIRARGQMAGDLRGQDFNEASSVAHAQDMRDQFNNSERYRRSMANWEGRNEAGQARYLRAQDRANILTGQAAQAQQQWGQGGHAANQTVQGAYDYYQADQKKKKNAGGSQYSKDEDDGGFGGYYGGGR